MGSNNLREIRKKGLIGKWVLKKAMEPYLPHNVIYRPKTGFGAPMRRWIKYDLIEIINEVLSVHSIQSRGLFNANSVHRLIADNHSGRREAAYAIFSLYALKYGVDTLLTAA